MKVPIESRLSGILEPVRPNPEFVNTLRERIRVVQQPALIRKFNNLQFIGILIAGLISAVFLVTMLARLLVSLLFPGKPPASKLTL